MHIGMRLLHPTAAGHSVIITRQQVQLFTSEPYHSAPDIYYECLLESTLSGKLLSWWYSASVVVVLPCWVDCTHQAALNPVCAASAHLPCELQHIKRAKSERAFTGVTSCISECGCYLVPGDGHDRCLSCLGIKVAFVDESCSHCGKISIEELRTRLYFLQRGRVPVPLPWSRAPPGSSWGSATSGSSWAGLTVMVRNSLWSCWRNRLDIHMVPLVSFGAPPDDRCRLLHRRVSQTFLEMMIRLHYHILGGQRCRIRVRKWWLCLPGPPRRSREETSTASRTLEVGRLIFRGGSRWFSGPHPGTFLSGSAWWGHWVEDGTFHCPKQPQLHVLPHHPQRWGSAGVYGDPTGGTVCCDAIVSKYRSHLAWESVAPLPWPAVLMRPEGKLPLPYMLWHCCRFIRTRHWGTCTREGMTQKFSKSFVPLLTSRYEQWRSLHGL